MGGAQRGERAPGADDAVLDQQRAVLGQRGRRIPGERIARRVNHVSSIYGHCFPHSPPSLVSPVVAGALWLAGRMASSAAATATAMMAGSLPVMPGWPIGQVIRAIASGACPAAASWAWNRV